MLKHSFFCMLVVLISVSCQPVLRYGRTLPPEIDVSGYTDGRIISLYDTSAIDFNQEKKRRVYKEAYGTLTKGLLRNLRRELDIAVDFTQLTGYDSLPSDAYIDIADTLNEDILVALTYFDLDRDQDVEVTEDDDGEKTRTAYYTLTCRTKIICLNADREMVFDRTVESGELIDKRTVISGLLAIGPSVGNHGKTANRLANDVSDQFMAAFFPSEVEILRSYYANKELKGVKTFFESQDWPGAEKFLLDLWDKHDPDLEKKIAHNLSLIYEATGDMEESRRWASKSKKPTDFFREGVQPK